MASVKQRLGGAAAGFAFRAVRGLVLGFSDRDLARLFRAVRWLGYLAAGDAQLRMVTTDVIEIFEGGPPGTDVVRKMMREADLDLARDVARAMMGI